MARHLPAALALALLAPPAASQDGAPPDAPPAAQRLPAQIVLGRRVEIVRQRTPVSSTLVIVPDADVYLAQLARWSPAARWPVLIDDGSDRAREGIARFVRAFGPAEIVRWSPDPAGAEDEPERLEDRAALAVARAWGAASPDGLRAAWAGAGHAPPGIVVTAADHPCWTAAVALAAGRGQPLAWIRAPRRPVGGQMDRATFGGIDAAVRAEIDRRPFEWKGVGDVIDAVTLCLDVPGRVEGSDDKGPRALTDLVGRHPGGERYAWAGWIYGDGATAAHLAMAALFLRPSEGWLFDAYGEGFPPQFAAEPALELFERMGMETTFTSPSGASLRFWRGRCRGGISADLVHVNSSGHAQWFQLGDDRAWASEIPMLHRPAMVHFIHSFSAQYPSLASSISERWLDNGAYAYAGSVDEPFLGAFQPPAAFFARLFSGAPFGVAARLDQGPAWKIQIIGDPLAVAGAERPRTPEPVEIPGAERVEDLMRAALAERRFDDAALHLVTLGRGDDLLRLVRSLRGDDPESITPAIARLALPAAFRDGDADLFADLYIRLPREAAEGDRFRSWLWQRLRPALPDADETVAALLRAHIRDESAAEDAADLAPALGRIYGPGAVRSMYRSLIERAPSESVRRELMQAQPKG